MFGADNNRLSYFLRSIFFHYRMMVTCADETVKKRLVSDELLAHVFTQDERILSAEKCTNSNIHKHHHLTTPWRSRNFRDLQQSRITLGYRVKQTSQTKLASVKQWRDERTFHKHETRPCDALSSFVEPEPQAVRELLAREMTFLNVPKRLTCLCHNNHFLPFAAQKHSDE